MHREYRGALGIKDPVTPEPLVPVLPHNYKYNGKEFQDEQGLAVYDYGRRNYDAAIGRFNKMDRFSEKYYNLTPYGYAGNNPVIFNDIQGDSIGIGKNLFEQFKNNVLTRKNNILNKRKKQIDKALADGKTDKAGQLEAGFSKEDAKKGSDMSILNATLSELSILESSSQVYNLFEKSSEVPSTADGITIYDTSTNAINISSRGKFSAGVFAHELKHAYQFQIGALSFGSGGKTGGQLYDLNDEYEAFDRGSYFGGLTLTKREINTIYTNRPAGPISMGTLYDNKTYGQHLKIQTYNNSVKGTAQTQFYINWQNNVTE